MKPRKIQSVQVRFFRGSHNDGEYNYVVTTDGSIIEVVPVGFSVNYKNAPINTIEVGIKLPLDQSKKMTEKQVQAFKKIRRVTKLIEKRWQDEKIKIPNINAEYSAFIAQ